MNLYVDPKDHGIETADPTLYKAWEKRRELRLEHFRLGKEIEKLDTFIETYLGMIAAPTGVPRYKLVIGQGQQLSELDAPQ